MTYHINTIKDDEYVYAMFETQAEAEAFVQGAVFGQGEPEEFIDSLTCRHVEVDPLDELVAAVKNELPAATIDMLKKKVRSAETTTGSFDWIVELHHGDGSWGRSGNCSGTYATAGEAFSAIQQFGNPFDVTYRVRNTATNETAEVDE